MHLRILDDIVETVGTIHRICHVLARQDPDLSKPMKRAINSVGLNSAEGLSAGYLDAARVVREVDTLDRIVATLYKLAYRSGARADRTRAAEGSPSGLVSSPGRFFASS